MESILYNHNLAPSDYHLFGPLGEGGGGGEGQGGGGEGQGGGGGGGKGGGDDDDDDCEEITIMRHCRMLGTIDCRGGRETATVTCSCSKVEEDC